MAGNTHLSKSERERRDARVFRMFAEGATYREIAEATGFRSTSGVHRVVQRELAAGASRRDVLTDDAFALWQERQETLLRAHWDRATRAENPDHRSAELCRKLLANQARVYRLGEVVQELPGPTQKLGDDGQADDEDQDDDLSRLRAKRNQTS